MECVWCGNIIQGKGTREGFCSKDCKHEAQSEYDTYIDWYNDYMTGYDVPNFEKISKKPNRKEEQ